MLGFIRCFLTLAIKTVVLVPICFNFVECSDWVLNRPSTPWPVLSGPADQPDMSTLIDAEFAGVDGLGDGEGIDAMEHFFWQMTGGVVLEMGAVDGFHPNANSPMLEKFGWRRILIEANPLHKEALKQHKDAFSANVAICAAESTVHYAISKQHPLTNGIVEFMDETFLKKWQPGLYKAAMATGIFNLSAIDWSGQHVSTSHIAVLQCVPLSRVLKDAAVTHVNLLILDVEGAEISILREMDWSSIRFDVIIVEKNHPQLLRQFFEESPDYNFVIERGRNFWAIHKDFKPSSRPGVANDCYRGNVKAGIYGCKRTACSTSLPIPTD